MVEHDERERVEGVFYYLDDLRAMLKRCRENIVWRYRAAPDALNYEKILEGLDLALKELK